MEYTFYITGVADRDLPEDAVDALAGKLEPWHGVASGMGQEISAQFDTESDRIVDATKLGYYTFLRLLGEVVAEVNMKTTTIRITHLEATVVN